MSHTTPTAILAAIALLACSDSGASPNTSPDATDIAVAPDADTEEREVITTIRCPVARFAIAEGTEVLPDTILHLDATASYGDQSAVAHYDWTLSDPNGAEASFSPDLATPTLTLATSGFHTIKLTVTDERGIVSCVPFEQRVRVAMADAIRIEVSWSTPNDPDTGGPGADLDLHFLHPLAVGSYDGDGDRLPDGWFDLPFDCFWSNDNPNWGRLDDTFDNPELIESTLGGPEILTLDLPEATTYRVGVNYWSDHDLGPALVTVRIYYSGALVFDVHNVALEEHDMWSVTTLTWPPSTTPPTLTRVCSGTTVECTADTDCPGTACGPRIAPAYSHPDFFNAD